MIALKLSNWAAYKQLMRTDRPIGWQLLLWPTLWALWLGSHGLPDMHLLVVFSAGVFLMRSAGCVINDYADRDFDGHVERTKNRPLASGKVSEKEAILLFLLLVGLSFLLVLTLDIKTILLSVVGLLLAAIYPFMKRYTHFPQIVLGAAFGWSIPMAFMASMGEIPDVGWWLYVANLLWTVAYDTYYAMVDREDDISIGVKSTAIFFGKYDLSAIVLCQFMTLAIFSAIGHGIGFNWWYWLWIGLSAALFSHQFLSAKSRNRDACFKAFLDNNKVGCCLFIAIASQYLFVPY